jgi:peroxiredoxin
VLLASGLYYADRYWIAPAVKTQAKTGQKHPFAPDFSLTDISGKKLNLSDYKGKVVLLDFWATWCGPCLMEMPGFVELQNRYGSQGFAIIGISMDDSMGPVVQFYTRYKMNFPVALGDAKMEEEYGGVVGLPTTFLIGRDGRIYAEHMGSADPGVFEEEIKELLAMGPTAEAQDFRTVGGARGADDIELGDPEEINSEVPGVNLSHLTTAQKDAFKKQLETQQCTCGCKLSLLKCRQVDRACRVSRTLARQELDKFLKAHAS